MKSYPDFVKNKKIEKIFSSEKEAREWEKKMLATPGAKGDTGGKGWRYEWLS